MAEALCSTAGNGLAVAVAKTGISEYSVGAKAVHGMAKVISNADY